MLEEWRPCPGKYGSKYKVSNYGFIKGPRGFLEGSWAKGYLRVVLNADGETKTKRVNVLVCWAFHGPAPSIVHQAAHLDGQTQNNRSDNLAWKTPKENMDDRILHGTLCKGDTHPCSQINAIVAYAIRRDFNKDCLNRMEQGFVRASRGIIPALAEEYGVTEHIVRDIVNNRSWRV